MPHISRLGSRSARAFGFGAQAPVTYWADDVGSADDYPYSIATDSNGNCYLAGSYSSGAFGDVSKFLPNGSSPWDFQVQTGYRSIIYSATVHGSYLYLAGEHYNATQYEGALWKLDLSGSVQWFAGLGLGNTSGNLGASNQSVAVDSSGNVYVVGYSGALGVGPYIAKYNSSGTIQWQKAFNNSYKNLAVAVDSSDNVLVLATDFFTQSVLIKYDSSLSLQWNVYFTASSATYLSCLAVDTSNNVILGGAYTSNKQWIVKVSSAGSVTWQKTLTGLGYISIAVDSNNNAYATGVESGNAPATLVKYDSSGNVVWQRDISYSGASQQYGNAVAVTSNAVFVGVGSLYSGHYHKGFVKVPLDGSHTGTSGNWTFSASSMTAGTTSVTASSLSPTLTTTSMATSSSAPSSTLTTVSVTTHNL